MTSDRRGISYEKRKNILEEYKIKTAQEVIDYISQRIEDKDTAAYGSQLRGNYEEMNEYIKQKEVLIELNREIRRLI